MNFANLMQQAQQMQRKVNKAKKTFNEKEFDFASQNNIINGKIKGDFEITELHIDQSMMNQESKEDVEALLIVTLNQKMKEIEKEREDTLNKITNGVDAVSYTHLGKIDDKGIMEEVSDKIPPYMLSLIHI